MYLYIQARVQNESQMLNHLSRSVLLLILVGFAALVAAPAGPAYAFPPAGTDAVQISADISFTSRLGQEAISFTGVAAIARSDPYDDGGVQVVDLEMTSLTLGGESVTGPVVITQSTTIPSLGEIRSNQPGQDWPASTYLDVFVEVMAPASPSDTISKYNIDPIHALPTFGGEELTISSWPPNDVPWEASLSPCIPLYPTLPKDVCVTTLSMTMSTVAGVGGFSELPSVLATRSEGPGARAMLVVAGFGVVLAVCAMLLFRRRFAD